MNPTAAPSGGGIPELGAICDGSGVRFAIYSERAAAVDLLLFGPERDEMDVRCVDLTPAAGCVWSAYVDGVGPGQRYAYRVDGPWDPGAGDRFDRRLRLLDPYARAIAGPTRWHPSQLDRQALAEAPVPADTQGADGPPPCVVVGRDFDWGDDRPPRTPWEETVLYECHVKGISALHPEVPAELRGTYLGLASAAVIDHLSALGVTAVELLPVQQAFTERPLVEIGLTNYWGYNTLGYFAPEARYATASDGQQVSEFKSMVKALHAAGIEVILDVVFNHTGEGGRSGPTLSFRGIDNQTYYRLDAADRRHYLDYSGCLNSLDLTHPQVLRLVADSLRYWVDEMHVDGFRFDLATALGRRDVSIDLRGGLFAIIEKDPVLSRVKLIAEPWDCGADGYRLGEFPQAWSEWNDRFRDTARRFWSGDAGQVADLATRLAGSRDLFRDEARRPRASINYVTAHDGFTLADIVRYAHKHNQGNGDGNRDGADYSHSHNWGVEGESDDPAVRRVRERVARGLLATLVLSLGTPMLSHGDELLRTQRGNNNAYCQDNEISWVSWTLDAEARNHLDFVRRLIGIRRAHPGLRRRSYPTGDPPLPGAVKDVTWMRADGAEMTLADWHDVHLRNLGMMLRDEEDAVSPRPGDEGAPLLLLLVNGGDGDCRFELPASDSIDGAWQEIVQTTNVPLRLLDGALAVPAHGLVLLSGRIRGMA